MNITNPFRFHGPACEDLMIGREKERKQLLSIIKTSQSALLYASRRFGKTWLLEIVAQDSIKQKIIPIYFDLFPVASTIHFLESYTTSIVKAFAKTSSQAQEFCKNYVSFMNPQVTVTGNRWFITYNWERTENAIKRVSSELFNLPEMIAKKEKTKLCVIFDEFQEINRLNGEQWEKEMRSIFQQHKKVAYIFSGSKTHIILNMFTNARRPFYQSAAIIALSEISKDDWKKFIINKFKKNKIIITDNVINKIILFTNGNPYYTQLLCYFLWEQSYEKGKITVEDVSQCLTETLENEDAYFRQLWDELPLVQKQLLMAIVKEGGKHIFSGDFMIANSLGPASSIRLAATYLTQQKGILDKIQNEYKFTDPFFRIWVQRETIGF